MRKNLCKVLSVAIAFSLVLGTIVIAPDNSKKVEAAQEWVLEWSDEFNGTSLDESIWNYEIGTGNWGWGNNEQQYYRKENLTVNGGTMKITAKKESYGGKNYTSSRIQSKNKKTVKYGKIEARMRLPKFKGAWPAFWMLGSSGNWPGCGKIDIMEAINDENKTYSTLHWDFNGNQADTNHPGVTVADRTAWHTYGMEWDKDKFKFYVDDNYFFEQTISDGAEMQEFRQNAYFIFNFAIGGQWPGYEIDDSAFPATMEVDYVRVYKLADKETTKYDGPMIEVTEDAVTKSGATWNSYFGTDWAGATGTSALNGTSKDGITINATAIGSDRWGVQASLKRLPYYPGATYHYKCTLTSDVDKVVFVKIAGTGDDELFGQYISLKANTPYDFSCDYTVPEDYDGVLDLFFGLGRCDGDILANNQAATINISNISFTTTTLIPDPQYTQPSTTKNPSTTNDSTNKKTTAAINSTIAPKKAKKPGRVKIKSAKNKSKRSVKVKVKKIKGVSGYLYRWCDNKKFQGYEQKKTKKTTYTIKKLEKKSKCYIKVRAYKKNGKNIVYGKWSKVKKVKINK